MFLAQSGAGSASADDIPNVMARMLFDIVGRFLTWWDQHAVALGPATIATIDFLENLSGSLSLLLREFEQVEVDAFGRATETGDSSRHDGMVGERGTSSAYFYSCTEKKSTVDG